MRAFNDLFTLFVCFFCVACATNSSREKDLSPNWTFTRTLPSAPRGGSTRGSAVVYANGVPQSWLDLQEKGISRKEKDRRAILSLAGEFEAKFEFVETFLMNTEKTFDKPYRSWGTELVKVIQNQPNLISLQHIMVMYFEKDGKKSGPFVMKHWRQDWLWKPKSQVVYHGDNKWSQKKVSRPSQKGHWLWTVYHVDDTPRYSSLGKWSHHLSASLFETHSIARPLPRRERTMRSDYNVLLGKDSLVVTPTAWFHEQKNLKCSDGVSFQPQLRCNGPYRSREIGHNSYRRISNYNFSEGYKYWQKSKVYWFDVQKVWETLFSKGPIKLQSKVNGQFMFAEHFANAENQKILTMNPKQRRKLIKNLVLSFTDKN